MRFKHPHSSFNYVAIIVINYSNASSAHAECVHTMFSACGTATKPNNCAGVIWNTKVTVKYRVTLAQQTFETYLSNGGAWRDYNGTDKLLNPRRS